MEKSHLHDMTVKIRSQMQTMEAELMQTDFYETKNLSLASWCKAEADDARPRIKKIKKNARGLQDKNVKTNQETFQEVNRPQVEPLRAQTGSVTPDMTGEDNKIKESFPRLLCLPLTEF